MRRKLPVVSGLLAVATVLAVSVATGPRPAVGAVPDERATAPLHLTADSQARVAGVFSRGDYLASFESRGTGPQQAVATVLLDGKRITISRDRATGRSVFGGGDTVLVAADRTAVRALADSLYERWQGRTSLPSHGDLLARTLNALTEAPLGVPLGTRVIKRPAKQIWTERTAAERTGACKALAKAPAGSSAARAAAAACQRGDQDNIKHFATCRTGKRWFGHDWTSHCYDSAQNTSGPGSRGCFGRCGAGCRGSKQTSAVDPTNVRQYTYDCGDHDQCALLHDENLGGCKDELNEALDDYIHADNTCPRRSAASATPPVARAG